MLMEIEKKKFLLIIQVGGVKNVRKHNTVYKT